MFGSYSDCINLFERYTWRENLQGPKVFKAPIPLNKTQFLKF